MERIMALSFDKNGNLRSVAQGLASALPEDQKKKKGYVIIGQKHKDIFRFFLEHKELANKIYSYNQGQIKKAGSEEVQRAIRERHDEIDREKEDLKAFKIYKLEMLQKEHFLRGKEDKENIRLGIEEMKKEAFRKIELEAEREKAKIPKLVAFPEIPSDFVLKDYRTMSN